MIIESIQMYADMFPAIQSAVDAVIGLGAAMLGSAALGTLGSALGGRSSAKDLKRAMQAQLTNAREQRAYNQQQIDAMNPYLNPYMQAGVGALDQFQGLMQDPSQVYDSPIFNAISQITNDQLARQQSLVGANNQAAYQDTGMLGSQNFLNALGQLQSGYGSLMNAGQNASGTMAQLTGAGISAGTSLTNQANAGMGALAGPMASAGGSFLGSLGNLASSGLNSYISGLAMPSVLGQMGVTDLGIFNQGGGSGFTGYGANPMSMSSLPTGGGFGGGYAGPIIPTS